MRLVGSPASERTPRFCRNPCNRIAFDFPVIVVIGSIKFSVLWKLIFRNDNLPYVPMTVNQNFERLLKITAFLFLTAQAQADPILSLTFDDPKDLFAAYAEGISLVDIQATPMIRETEIASGVGGIGRLKVDSTELVEGAGEPPTRFQLIRDTVMGTKAFLRLINDKRAPGTAGSTVITPSGFDSSLASFAQFDNGSVALNGGLDLFFRYTEENPSQPELVPNLFSAVGDGIRLFVESDGKGVNALFTNDKDGDLFDTDLDGKADAHRVMTSPVNPGQIDSEAVYHLAVSFQTADTGVVTVKVFLQSGYGAIDTREETDLVSTAEFRVITDDSEKSLKGGEFSIQADSRSGPERAILDLAAFRIFRPAPAIFPDISGGE